MPRTSRVGSLIADGIENPKNARALIDAGAMFEVETWFRDRASLLERWDESVGGALNVTSETWPASAGGPIVAVENAPGADAIYGAMVRPRSALVVGNERTGVGRDVLRAADKTLQIPTSGRRLNTLNVAAAAAVGLYVLSGTAPPGSSPTKPRPERHRPSLLLLAPADHVEVGSALRSAAALGWRTVGLDDSRGVWFDTPRDIRTEGRGAARSHRAALRVVRTPADSSRAEHLVVASPSVDGPPLHRVRMTRGSTSLVVIPDEAGIDVDSVPWGRLSADVSFARVPTALRGVPGRYRLVASVVMAEISRQLGIRKRVERPESRERLRYESAMRWPETGPASELTWDDLLEY